MICNRAEKRSKKVIMYVLAVGRTNIFGASAGYFNGKKISRGILY